MRFLDMLGIGRNGQLVEPHLRTFLRHDVIDDDALVGFGGAVARLEHVARPAYGEADVAVGQRIDVFGRVELADVGPDLHQGLFRLCEVLGRGGFGVDAQILEGCRDDVGRRVQHIDAAVGELRTAFQD